MERRGPSQSFCSVRPARLTVRAALLLNNNVDATSLATHLSGKGLVLEYDLVIKDYYLKVRGLNENSLPHFF
jgi:hypothetical protein